MKLICLYTSAIIVMVLALLFEREIIYYIGKVGSIVMFFFVELVIIANIINESNPNE